MAGRIHGLAAIALLAAVLPACDATASGACPEPVSDGGQRDGIDLAVPVWLPADFTLPDGASVRHVNDETGSGGRAMSAFVPGGEAASVTAELLGALRATSLEVLMTAEGFAPLSNPAGVALDAGSGQVMTVGATADRAPTRAGDRCPVAEGALLFITFEPVEVDVARAQWAGATLTRGTATGLVATQDFSAAGECLVTGQRHTFTSTAGDLIAVDFEVDSTEPPKEPTADLTTVAASGHADMNAASGDALWLFDDTDRAAVASFEVSATGFAVEGMFRDGIGDLGVLAGRIEVDCA